MRCLRATRLGGCLLLAALPVLAARLKGDGIGYFVNSDGSFGMTLAASESLKVWQPSWLGAYNEIGIGHTLEGVIGSKQDSLPNHLAAGAAASLSLLDWPGESWGVNLQAPGFAVEATQDFRKVDWTANVGVTLVQMSAANLLYRLLHPGDDPLNTLGPRPVSLSLGFAQVGGVLGPDSLGPGWRQRIDGRLFLTVAITRNLSLGFLGRAYGQPTAVLRLDAWRGMLEPAVTYKWKGIWMHVKYVRGSLPPLHQPASSWDIGLGFAFE